MRQNHSNPCHRKKQRSIFERCYIPPIMAYIRISNGQNTLYTACFIPLRRQPALIEKPFVLPSWSIFLWASNIFYIFDYPQIFSFTFPFHGNLVLRVIPKYLVFILYGTTTPVKSRESGYISKVCKVSFVEFNLPSS